ncbi:MAG: hypothetical protein ACYSWO_08640 [Planctomycetota bacterium]
MRILLLLLLPTVALGHDLPKSVQSLPAPQYEAWAYWQNAQAAARATKRSYEPSHLYADRTTVRSTGGRSAVGSLSGITRSYRGTTTRQGSTARSARSWGTTTVTTREDRYKNPDYTPPRVTRYNPFAKPTPKGHAPDWDNLYMSINGEIVTVTEAMTASMVPMHPEDLYRWFLRNTMGAGVVK